MIGSIIVLLWMVMIFILTNFDMERTGALSIGAIVGVVFSVYGMSAGKNLKNTVMIMGVSFLSTMIYDIVASVIHHLN